MHCAGEYEVESILSVAAGTIEIRRYHWLDPLDEVYCDSEPILGFSLSKIPDNSRASLGSRATAQFSPIGKLVFRPPNLPLRCVNSGGVQRLLICSFQPMGSLDADDGLCETLERARPQWNLRSEPIAAGLRRVAAEARAPGFGSLAVTEAMLTCVLVDLVRACGGLESRPARPKGGLAPWQIRRITEALREIDGAVPTVRSLAQLVGVTPRHLLRSFRSSTGSTVVRHIARAQFARACELLTTTDLPLKQVARTCGFETASGFAAAFRREAAESPREFRTRSLPRPRPPTRRV